MTNFIKRVIGIYFLVICSSATFAANYFSGLVTQEISVADREWFINEFVTSFMHVYADKTFIIGDEKNPTILGPKDIQKKREWLRNTAVEEFKEYVENPKLGHHASLILRQNVRIGAALYQENTHENIIYLAQLFITPEYQKKGASTYFLKNHLPAFYPHIKRFEVLARHQNGAAFSLYNRLDFTPGDEALVKKYGYAPLRYMSFFKNFRQ